MNNKKRSGAASPELEMRIGSELRDIGIPPRPDILTRIDAEMRKEEPDYRRLGEAIGSDVSLSASIIKVSNSPYFGLGRRVRSVPEALLVLGLKTAIQTIAGIALQRAFPHVPSLERFWDSAACTARVSGWLVRRLQDQTRLRPDDGYTFGLFRDCGIPVLMIPFPEYREILGRANNEAERSFTAVEDELLSINHASVGAELAQDWLLPEDTCQAMRHHHDVSVIAGTETSGVSLAARQLVAFGQIAEHLIQRTTGMNQTREWEKLGPVCLRLLGISADDLATLESEAGPVIESGD